MPADLAAHVASCPACRAHAASMEGIARCLADMRAFAAAIPAEVLEENKRRILAAIADKNAKPATRFARRTPAATTSRQQPAKDFSSPRIHPVLLWSAAGIAATLVMIFGLYFHDRTPATSAPEPVTPAAPVVAATHLPAKIVSPVTISSTNQERRTKNQELPVTLVWLQQEFARLKVAREGVTWDYLNKVVKYLTRDGNRTLDEKVDGWELLADAYGKAGEMDRSLNAFGKYLAFVEERDGKEKAIEMGTRRATVVFNREHDFLHGLAYYELLATRYPNTDARARALFMAGRYHYLQKAWPGAEQAYRSISEELPGTEWAKKAQKELWVVLWVQGKRVEAIAVLDEISRNTDDEKDKSYTDGNAAFVLRSMGIGQYPAAIQRLKRIAERAPGSSAAKFASEEIASMTRRMVNGSETDCL
jgi:tetratricopeptide (TPR) repeat protein